MNKTALRVTYATGVLSFILAVPAFAQYVGPSAVGEASVSAILQNPVDEQDVQLQGQLLRQIAKDKYVFSDGTGEIVAEIKAKRLPNEPINEKTVIQISGEVDTGFSRPPEIEVDSVRLVE